MTRVDDIKAQYEAELELAELEDELVKLKKSGKPEELRQVKNDLRAAREQQREAREAVVNPAETRKAGDN